MGLFDALFSGAAVHGAPKSSLFAANSKYHAPAAVSAPAAAAAAPAQPAPAGGGAAAATAAGGKKQKKRQAEQQEEQHQQPAFASDEKKKKKKKRAEEKQQQQQQAAPAPQQQQDEPQQQRQSKKARKEKGVPAAQQQPEQAAAAAVAAAAAAQAAHGGEDAAVKPSKKGKKSKQGNEGKTAAPADEEQPKQPKQKKLKKEKGAATAAAAKEEEQTLSPQQPEAAAAAAAGGKPEKLPAKGKGVAEQKEEDERLPRTVFVGNLPATVKRKAVTRLFARCGAVESVRLRSLPLKQLEEGAKGAKMPRRNAIAAGNIDTSHTANVYVVFEEEAAVEAALKLNMAEFEGHHLRVDRAAPKAAKGAVRFDPARSLFVGNLPLAAEDEQLIQLFGAAAVEAVRVVRDPKTGQGKGVAFVLFRSQEASLAALKQHKKGAMVGGRELRLTVAKRGAADGGKGKAAWQQGSASSVPKKGGKKKVNKPVAGKRKAGGKRPAVVARKSSAMRCHRPQDSSTAPQLSSKKYGGICIDLHLRHVALHARPPRLSAAGTRTDVNAGVAAAFRGLTPVEVEGVVRAHCPRLLAAVAAATRDARASPAAAAPSLRRLSAKFGTLLRMVAPGGTFAAAQPFAGLPALLDACTAATHSLAAAGSHRAAFVAAQAGLRLLSHLSFGCRADAAPYLAAALSFKLAATAAVAAGAPVAEHDVLALTAACARASGHLQMTPYYGHAYAAAVDALITDGWSSAQSAVEYAQSWCTLVAAGRLHFVPAKYARLLAAAQSHAHLTARQLDALLATQRTLPAHTTPPINAWLADWQAEASGRHASQQQQQRRRVAAAGPGAAVPAGASASSFAGYAVL
ncbi:RNA-binding 34 [Micractinium conductrix]|uniref:RNA-binding 34 n=1 Tax=Micractinium conductrix TaxID=554055 RepID=A0A2P6VIP5_9CHLO|nr:RNA-binding 34 [Micractinium conductrix]|eukprot:PSC73971.1 RNA-binding 34 [Micractinium conductrix]